MRYVVTLLVFFLSTIVFAQEKKESESTFPSVDTEIERKCSFIDIEGKYYYDAVISLKSNKCNPFMYRLLNPRQKSNVKVIVRDKNGKKIYKKVIKNTFLYIHSDGTISVAMPPELLKLKVIKDDRFGDIEWLCIIREKEGIW